MERRHRDAVAEAGGQHGRPAPVARIERPGALAQLEGRPLVEMERRGTGRPSARRPSGRRSARWRRWTIWSGSPARSAQRPAGWLSPIRWRPTISGETASQRSLGRGDAGVERGGDGERLEGRAELVDALDRVVAAGIRPWPGAGTFGIEDRAPRPSRPLRRCRRRGRCRCRPGRCRLAHRLAELVLHRRLDAAVDRQRQRLAAAGVGGQPVLQRALDAGDAAGRSASTQPSTWPPSVACG